MKKGKPDKKYTEEEQWERRKEDHATITKETNKSIYQSQRKDRKMEKGKYIIVLENGHKVPILFHTLITHDTFLKCYSKANIKSAGFFEVFKPLPDTIVVDTFGASQSLEISSDSEDCTLLSNFLKLEKL